MDKSQRSFITAAAFAVCISAVSVSSALAWLQPGSPPSRPAKTAWTIDDNTLTEGTIREGLAAPTALRVLDAGNDADALVSWTCADQQVTEFIIHRQRSIAGRWLDFGKLRLLGRQLSLRDTPGLGTFRYRVASATPTGNSAFTDWTAVDVQRSWTVFTPSPDARIIYVSSSGGNDANDGLSEARPKATIAAGYALLRHGFPDWLLLRRGDSWTESLGHWRKSGRSASELMIVGAFGDATARPLLLTGVSNGFSRTGGGGSPASIDFIALVGIDFHAHTRTPTDSGTGLLWIGRGSNLHVEDCRFRGYSDGMTIQGDTSRPQHVLIHRTSIVDSFRGNGHSQGLYADAVDQLSIADCLFDNNGWNTATGTSPTIFNHNIYIQTSCGPTIINNTLISRGSSHGLQLRSGGEVHNNLFIGNALAGFVSSDTGIPSHVTDNVVLHGRDITASLPRGSGLEVLAGAGQSTVVDGNIIAHRTTNGQNGFALAIRNQGSVVRNNVIYNWSSASQPAVEFSHPTPSIWTGMAWINNTVVLELPGGQPVSIVTSNGLRGNIAFANNWYRSSLPNPQWMRLGTAALPLTDWNTATGDNGATTTLTRWPDPSRSIPRYQEFLQQTDTTIEAFLAAAKANHKRDWRVDYTAPIVNNWIREGFGR